METLLAILRFIWILFLVIMVFNLMIIVHEWGHFLAARWRGLVVDRFQIWFGKPIWKKTVNGVQYGLGTIPAGGFVSLPQMVTMESVEGEVEDEVKKDLPPIKPIDKIIVAFAGPLFSFLLAVFFAVIVYYVGKPMPDAKTSRVVGYVAEGGPGEKAGIQPGDKIIAVDGKPIKNIHGMVDSMDWNVIAAETDEVKVEFERNGEQKETTLDATITQTPKQAEEAEKKSVWQKFISWVFDRPPLPFPGVFATESPRVGEFVPNGPAQLSPMEKGDVILKVGGQSIIHRSQVADYVKDSENQEIMFTVLRGEKEIEVPLIPRKPEIRPKEDEEGFEAYNRPMVGIQWDQYGKGEIGYPTPGEQVKNSLLSMKNTLGAIFTPDSKIKGTHLSSAVGIMRLYYRLFEHPDGWRLVLWFSVVLNINLAILNMLPIPILDGGHIVMATVEGVTRKPLPQKFLTIMQTLTFFFLIGLMVVLLFKDVGDIAKGTGATGPKVEFLPLDAPKS